ncbi:hypothetical protein ACIBTP_41785 [Streptomyces avidinii]|uniref:hypothetical protein n=1 Tax=Streptomyces avidinii TaxID=1895 RepID=UPI00378C23DE
MPDGLGRLAGQLLDHGQELGGGGQSLPGAGGPVGAGRRVERGERNAFGQVQPPQPACQGEPAAPPPPGLRQEFTQVRKEYKYANWAVKGFLELVWPFLLTLFGAALSGAMAPEVAEQKNFMGVFLATLAWSSGVALFVFILTRRYEAGPVQYSILATACPFAGAWVAVEGGRGAYGMPIQWGKYGSSPLAWPLPALEAALATFGWAGVLLGGVCGALAGLWAARLWDKAAG